MLLTAVIFAISGGTTLASLSQKTDEQKLPLNDEDGIKEIPFKNYSDINSSTDYGTIRRSAELESSVLEMASKRAKNSKFGPSCFETRLIPFSDLVKLIEEGNFRQVDYILGSKDGEKISITPSGEDDYDWFVRHVDEDDTALKEMFQHFERSSVVFYVMNRIKNSRALYDALSEALVENARLGDTFRMNRLFKLGEERFGELQLACKKILMSYDGHQAGVVRRVALHAWNQNMNLKEHLGGLFSRFLKSRNESGLGIIIDEWSSISFNLIELTKVYCDVIEAVPLGPEPFAVTILIQGIFRCSSLREAACAIVVEAAIKTRNISFLIISIIEIARNLPKMEISHQEGQNFVLRAISVTKEFLDYRLTNEKLTSWTKDKVILKLMTL